MQKKEVIVYVSLVIGVLLFGFILGKMDFANILPLLQNVRWWHIIGYMASSMAMMFGFAYIWKIIMRAHHKEIPYMRLFNFRLVDFAISYLTSGPSIGGEFTRAALLEREDMDYSEALSFSVIDKMLEILANAIYLMAGVILVSLLIKMPLGVKIILFAIAIIFLGIVLAYYILMIKAKSPFITIFKFFRLHKLQKVKDMEKSLQEFEDHMQFFYKEHGNLFYKALGLSLLRRSISLLEYYFLLAMIGIEVSVAKLFLINSVTGIVYLLPIPLGIGALEAGQISVFAILGLSSGAAVLVAMITRIRDLVWSIIGLLNLGYYGIDFKKFIAKTLKK